MRSCGRLKGVQAFLLAVVLASDPALQLMERIDRAFWLTEPKAYAEKPGSRQPAFNWGVGVALGALNAAARHDPKWVRRLRDYLPAVRRYWNEAGPVPGFDVLPGPKPVDRYYDDNAWMAIALLETAEVLKEPEWADLAAKTVAYVLSGRDEKLGGGIYWKEAEKTSKNTCSNAPSAAAILALHARRPDSSLLQEAVELYAWTKAKLCDPVDGLYWDNMRLDGTIEKTKWSYNSALMLRTAIGLHEVTKRPQYKEDADRIAKAAAKRWILADGKITCEGRFAHLLVEDLVAYENRYKVDVFDQGRVRASILALAGNGWIGKRWDAPASGDVELIDQVSAVRALLVLSTKSRANRPVALEERRCRSGRVPAPYSPSSG